MEKDIEKVKPLDIEYIQKKLQKCYKYTKEAKGCDLVIVIGNTGAGKSTTCNYLLGHKMKANEHKGRRVIETVDETDIKIGHEVKAETLYAKTITIDRVPSANSQSGNSICLLDCPGFLGNKTRELKVIESISTELALRNAREIKGILILISINDLLEKSVENLRKLVKTLISLFKNPLEMVQYSIFIITKKYEKMPESEAKAVTIGSIEALRQFCEEQKTYYFENENLSSSEGLTYVEYDRIATYFSAVLERENIIFIDPLDNGQSKTLIFDRINGIEPRREESLRKMMVRRGRNMVRKIVGSCGALKPITINDFNFSEYEDTRISFNKAMYDIADHGLRLINKIRQDGEKIQNFNLKVSDFRTKLLEANAHKFKLEEDLQKITESKKQYLNMDFESVKSWKSMILQNDCLIESKQSEIEEINAEEKKLIEELISIDTDVAMEFIKDDISKTVSWWKLFGWEELKFVANTEDETIPIIDVKKHMLNGKWIDEIDEREKGIYQITYRSKFRARPAEAWVTTYIKTKDEVGNRILIKSNKTKISQLTHKKATLKAEIDDLMSHNLTLKSNIEESENSSSTCEDMIKVLKEDLRKSGQNIEHLNSEVEKEIEQMNVEYLIEFKKNRYRYAMLVDINEIMQFPSSLITQFASEYRSFTPDNYKFIFERMASVSFEFPDDKEDKIVDLKNVRKNQSKVLMPDNFPQSTYAELKINQMPIDQLEKQKCKFRAEKTQIVSEHSSFKPFNYKFMFEEMDPINFKTSNEKENELVHLKNLSENETNVLIPNCLPPPFPEFEINQMSIDQPEERKCKVRSERTQFDSEPNFIKSDHYKLTFEEMASVSFTPSNEKNVKIGGLKNIGKDETEDLDPNFLSLSTSLNNKFEINQAPVNQFDEQKSKIRQEIQQAKVYLEVKEAELKEICYHLERRQLKSNKKQSMNQSVKLVLSAYKKQSKDEGIHVKKLAKLFEK